MARNWSLALELHMSLGNQKRKYMKSNSEINSDSSWEEGGNMHPSHLAFHLFIRNLSLLETFPWFQKMNRIILTAFFSPKERKFPRLIFSETADPRVVWLIQKSKQITQSKFSKFSSHRCALQCPWSTGDWQEAQTGDPTTLFGFLKLWTQNLLLVLPKCKTQSCVMGYKDLNDLNFVH